MLTSSTIALILAGFVSASAVKRAPYAGVISSCTSPNTVALTFVSNLRSQWSATYLTDGHRMMVLGSIHACIYDDDSASTVLYVSQAGHQLASHTWSHPDLTTLNADQIASEFQRINDQLQAADAVADALVKIAGVLPAFVRPPYGNYNDLVQQVAANFNQSLVMWDFDSGDSTGSTPAQSEAAYDALIGQHPNNILALNHDTYGEYLTAALTMRTTHLKII
ncbi:hypothetical protein H0H92_003831 [Tricholoma furcatifolium]|nr:hypothetical protein H0H92_003831 [Tricholoma furcatifolium]